jgi:beta-lactamase regulating signal transducer with metallopeptidase domain
MTSQIIITYILKTILISSVFIAYYWIALRDKKFHYYNRFYLLTVSILSLIIPLLKFSWYSVEKPVLYSSNEIVQYILPLSSNNINLELNWVDYILFIAGIITISLLMLLIINVLKIQLLKSKSEVTQMNGFDFIYTDEDNAPFSFLNNLFWKQSISLQDEGAQQIFKHEITHIQQKHTWDRIYCQFIASIFWMNPFNWIIQKELTTIHEFIADELAVGDSNVEAFAKMLLQTHYGNHFLNPTHQFFYSSIKRRLFMLNQNKKTKFSHLRRLFVLPITICVVLSFSIKTIEVKASTIIRERFENPVSKIKNPIDLLVSDTSKPKKQTAPTPPSPPTPPTPPNLESSGLRPGQVRVTSKTSTDTLVVTSSGSNKDKFSNVTLTTKDKQKVLDALEKKANVVIEKKTENGSEKYIIVENNPSMPAVKPLIYVDGVKMTEDEMKAISPSDIESVNVLKGENAIKKYADDGKVGVIEIKLKHKN